MSHGQKEYKRDRDFLGEKVEVSLSSRLRVLTAYPAGDHKRQANRTKHQRKDA